MSLSIFHAFHTRHRVLPLSWQSIQAPLIQLTQHVDPRIRSKEYLASQKELNSGQIIPQKNKMVEFHGICESANHCDLRGSRSILQPSISWVFKWRSRIASNGGQKQRITPFLAKLKVGKTNYCPGKMDLKWAKCLKSGQNFSRSGNFLLFIPLCRHRPPQAAARPSV